MGPLKYDYNKPAVDKNSDYIKWLKGNDFTNVKYREILLHTKL